MYMYIHLVNHYVFNMYIYMYINLFFTWQTYIYILLYICMYTYVYLDIIYICIPIISHCDSTISIQPFSIVCSQAETRIAMEHVPAPGRS